MADSMLFNFKRKVYKKLLMNPDKFVIRIKLEAGVIN